MQRSSLVALIVASAFFMQGMDSSIVSSALPQIAASFGEDPVRLSGAITSYIISLAIFIPISGWLADRFGARTIFQAAIVAFLIGSTICAASSNVIQLDIARMVQGVGGAMLVPVGRLVMLRTVGKAGLVAAMAVLSVPAQMGPLLGPPLGGVIVTYLSWRWIFLVNLPIGLLGLVLASLHIENFREEKRRPLDWKGFFLFGGAMACTIYGLDAIGRSRSDPQFAALILLCGLLIGACAVWHAKRCDHPLIDLSLIKIPTFAANFWGGTLFRVGLGSLSFLLPLLFQIVFGLSVFVSGLLIFTSSLGAVAMKATTPPILRRFGYRQVVIWNGTLAALALVAYAFFEPSTPMILILLVLMSSGFVQSLQFSTLNSLPYADVPVHKMSGATSLSQLMQQIGKGVGVATAASMLNLSLAWRGGTQLSTFEFKVTLLVSAVISLASILFFIGLRKDAGAEMSGHSGKPALEPSPPQGP
ncbi:MAG: MFS transporter [Alphaproteobacteria bacterium]|nr:MFS transporter [Alphaproteobacteria bacterium]